MSAAKKVKVTAEQALTPAPAPAPPMPEMDNLSKAPSSVTTAASPSQDVERAGEAAEKPNAATRSGNEMSGKNLVFAFVGMLLSIFLIALDQTILASALPVCLILLLIYTKL
jgi:Flp pilus assembly protein TadB